MIRRAAPDRQQKKKKKKKKKKKRKRKKQAPSAALCAGREGAEFAPVLTSYCLVLAACCLALTGHSSLFTVLIGHCSQAQTHREQSHRAARFPSERPSGRTIRQSVHLAVHLLSPAELARLTSQSRAVGRRASESHTVAHSCRQLPDAPLIRASHAYPLFGGRGDRPRTFWVANFGLARFRAATPTRTRPSRRPDDE